MDAELKAPARLLSTGTAPNIAAEVTYDLVRRTTLPASALMRLGQYVATSRVLARRAAVAQQRELDRQRQQTQNVIDSAAHTVAAGISAAFSAVSPGSGSRHLESLGANDALVLAAVLRACCDAAGNGYSNIVALALAGGLGVALRRELGAHAEANELVKHAYSVVSEMARRAVRLDAASRTAGFAHEVLGVLGECAPTAACLATLAGDEHVTGTLGAALFDGGAGNDEAMAHGAALVGELMRSPALQLEQAERLAAQMHGSAVEALVAAEQHGSPCGGALAQAVVRVAESVLLRYFVDENKEQIARLISVWCLLVDALACVHAATLRVFGRAGGDAFRRATTLAVAYVTERATASADECVHRVFAMQPCLRFAPSLSLQAISQARLATVLFYLDLMEHVAPHLMAHTLVNLVLPLAARYAGSTPGDQISGDLFESAHALVLAALEPPVSGGTSRPKVVVEVASWYAALVLKQHKAGGLSADLMLIAYTAAVRALASVSTEHVPQILRYVWDCVAQLLELIPPDGGLQGQSRVRKELEAVRRRELMQVLAEMPAAVPVELLPRLLPEIRRRVVVGNGAAREAAVMALQDVVMVRADVARKPALAAWVMQLRLECMSKL